MAPHDEREGCDWESLQLKSSSRGFQFTCRLNIARYCQLVLALVVTALSGSMIKNAGLLYTSIFTLSLLALVLQIILLIYINVVPRWASKLYVHTAHVLLEIFAIILNIFNFFLLIGQCDAWGKSEDNEISSVDEAAAMTEMFTQVPHIAILEVAACISGAQVLLGAGILIIFVTHIRL